MGRLAFGSGQVGRIVFLEMDHPGRLVILN